MSVYVITHKRVAIPAEEGYKILQVGAEKGHIDFERDTEYDDIGDNISSKNSTYCELTGLYWLWKNCDDDYIGIVHYRRFFSHKFNGRILKEKEIKALLKKSDVILPFHHKLGKTVKEQYLESGYEKDLDILEEVLKEKYPEYMPSYTEIMRGKRIYFFNMFITNKKTFDKYSEWLFDILFEVEERVNISEYDDYHKRIFGFMSERLMYVFMKHNKVKIKEVGVVNTEERWTFKKKFLTGCKRELLYIVK